MKLEELGFNESLEKFRTVNDLNSFETGRVIAEHKERYIVKTEAGDIESEITGNMRYTASSREDFPAVGDWVALTIYDAGSALIHKIYPRYSTLQRQAVGQTGEIQIIAANIDYAFLMQAVDRDFNINRLERYLTICYSSGVEPVIVLTKTDLVSENRLSEILEHVKSRIENVPLFTISNESHAGYRALQDAIKKGKTYCMLGSSGVGKSTLMNNLSGRTVMKTDRISDSTNKGRHVTSHRELTILENGGILIDNPGMREVGIADAGHGLATAFDKIIALTENCRYIDCSHTGETGCAVIDAVEKGEIDAQSYENYLKMEREKAHFDSTVAERRKKEKDFAKVVRDYKKKFKNRK